MNTFLEILKLTLPALIVFATVYYMFRTYMNAQYAEAQLKKRKSENLKIIGIKLQAYERLIIFCERIHPQSLFLRLNAEGLSAKDIQTSMILAIQQEYEFNLTQQLYVSSSLWKIILLAKDQTLNILSQTADKLPPDERPERLMEILRMVEMEMGGFPNEKAKYAIKQEADILLQIG